MLRHMLWESMEPGRSNDVMMAGVTIMMAMLVGINPEAVSSNTTSSHNPMAKDATADVDAMVKARAKAVRAIATGAAIILMLTAAMTVGIIRI